MELHPSSILQELQRPDDRALAFSPYGLGGRLAPEDAASFQTASIDPATLAQDVPDDVRNNFERARKLHCYGLLDYEFFTAAFDYALLVLEGALRVRFLTYYSDGIPVLKAGVKELLRPASFDEVRGAGRAKLLGPDGGIHPLPVGAGALTDWARREGLLIGTRSRIVDRVLSELRNHAAHPVAHTIIGPPDCARTLCDVAETINRLWGHDTPGGRLFPAPVRRYPTVAALAPEGRGGKVLRLEQLAELGNEAQGWDFAVFLAADTERLLDVRRGRVTFAHEPGFQTTLLPCEQLWTGSRQELIAQIDGGAFAGREDTVAHLDRLFFIRIDAGSIDLARSAADLLALREPPKGAWYALTADTPVDAWVHVRDHEPDAAAGHDVCPECCVVVRARLQSTAQTLALANASQGAP